MQTIEISKALTEVRDWRSQVQREYEGNAHLSFKEQARLATVRMEELKKLYNLNLKKVTKA